MAWLLAAEADQIQDVVFRASHLREVIGGSQLLSRFCREGAKKLLKHHPGGELIVNDGGAFRIRFNSRDAAKGYGRDLAELYRQKVGGNLTVADPVAWNDGFKAASDDAQRALRDAKSRGEVPGTTIHLPYAAFCASCGVGLALDHERRHDDEDPNYLCADCRCKAVERDEESGEFLDLFRQAIGEGKLPFPEPRDWLKAIGELDLTGRRYVAYLLADGNGMGRTFSACPTHSKMRELSEALPQVIRESLAVPCRDLLKRMEEANKKRVLPVVPLILGGDDLFALLPASWSIDVAGRFCLEYQERLVKQLRRLGLSDAKPTVAAAVVICKANYPHTLAHQRGDELLKHAKRMARGLEQQGLLASVVNGAVIAAHEVGLPAEEASSRYRPTAAPYSVGQEYGDAALSLELLVKHRNRLTKLPGKRRGEFERLYHEMALLQADAAAARWNRGCTTLLKRIGQRDEDARKALENALRELGGPARAEVNYWRYFDRPFGEGFWGSGLADLLELWPYCYDVTKSLDEYEGA
jgi:hypothetical protein